MLEMRMSVRISEIFKCRLSSESENRMFRIKIIIIIIIKTVNILLYFYFLFQHHKGLQAELWKTLEAVPGHVTSAACVIRPAGRQVSWMGV